MALHFKKQVKVFILSTNPDIGRSLNYSILWLPSYQTPQITKSTMVRYAYCNEKTTTCQTSCHDCSRWSELSKTLKQILVFCVTRKQYPSLHTQYCGTCDQCDVTWLYILAGYLLESWRKLKRQQQWEHQVMGNTNPVHAHCNSWYISLPICAKQILDCMENMTHNGWLLKFAFRILHRVPH